MQIIPYQGQQKQIVKKDSVKNCLTCMVWTLNKGQHSKDNPK